MIAKNKQKQRVTLFLDPELLKQAKAQAVLEEISLTALVEKSLNKYLPEKTVFNKAEIKTATSL